MALNVDNLKRRPIRGPHEPSKKLTAQISPQKVELPFGMRFNIHRPSLAYAGLSLGNAMMNSIFGFYYVNVYLNRFHVSQGWFQTAQVIFMLWNAINDPLFGYFQDNFNFSWVKSRRHSILYGAPWFVLSFLLLWFPWADYSTESWLAGFQLMVVLCFYDAMFTFVLLAQCALFTEMSTRQEDRIRLVQYSQVATLIGSSSVFFANLISDNLQHYYMFCATCVVIGILAFFAITYTGRNADSAYDIAQKEENKSLGVEEDAPMDRRSEYSIWRQTFQIVKQRDFLSFVFMNFCQIFLNTFLSNFTAIICDTLISKEIIGTGFRSAFYGSLFIFPQVLVLLGASFVGQFGYYYVIRMSFILQIVIGSILFCLGPFPWVLMFFFFGASVVGSATFSLFNLPLSDVIDKDKKLYKRSTPLSSMVFGTNALITKPAVSFAPIIVVWLLNQAGYEHFKPLITGTAAPPKVIRADQHQFEIHDLHSTMFYVTCAIPMIIGTVQLIVWSFYTIRDTHETMAKHTEQ